MHFCLALENKYHILINGPHPVQYPVDGASNENCAVWSMDLRILSALEFIFSHPSEFPAAIIHTFSHTWWKNVRLKIIYALQIWLRDQLNMRDGCVICVSRGSNAKNSTSWWKSSAELVDTWHTGAWFCIVKVPLRVQFVMTQFACCYQVIFATSLAILLSHRFKYTHMHFSIMRTLRGGVISPIWINHTAEGI